MEKIKKFKINNDSIRELHLQQAYDAISPLLCGPDTPKLMRNSTEGIVTGTVKDPYMCWPPPVLDGHAISAEGWKDACCY